MTEYDLDTELHDALRGIRESVRKLFDELRLKGSEGDTSGTARLERVPALAKRNFGHLGGRNPDLARKEAWRLIDFLEGSEQARLSFRAREALRLTELDMQLAAFRASDRWKEAAARLREAIGARSHIRETARPSAVSAPAIESTTPIPRLADRSVAKHLQPVTEAKGEPTLLTSRLRGRGLRILSAATVLLSVAVVAAISWPKARNPRQACIAIESASESALAEHWRVGLARPLPRPPLRAGALSHVFPIGDSEGGPVQSTWTTDKYSYAERTTRAGPGGGMSDFRLRVGGWGDTYLSLLQIPIPTNHLVQKAVIQLTVLGDEPESRPTSMTLRGIMESWRVDPGSDNRMWWRDCPQSYAIRNHLPPPGPPESVYEIDITDLYNLWARGERTPHGIILEPEHVGQWGAQLPHYSNFSTFYSTRVPEITDRPRLVLIY